jgi:RNA polymerase sigma factor (sigma-70 family)
MKRFRSILEFRIAQTLRIQWRIIYSELLSSIIKEESGKFKKTKLRPIIFPDLSEEETIFGLITLNDSILRDIYNKTFPEIERRIIFDGGRFEDAQDIFQMAVMILIEKVRQGRYNEKSTIYTYLYAIAENIWKNEKKLERRNKTFVYDKQNKFEKKGGTIEEGGMIDIEKPEGFEKIQKEVDMLPENCRKIINKYYYEELDMETIAKSLGYANTASLSNQKSKCLKKLKEKLT